MKFWKKLYNYLKGYEKWIEIKIPDYLKNKENDLFKKDEEEGIFQDIDEADIRKEEE
jgi:hypothetical protein